MSILSEARSLLLQAATWRDLSPAQRERMYEVAWDIAPCTCGEGPDAPTHQVECLNGLYTPAGEVEQLRTERDEAREQARGYRDVYNAVNPLASGVHDSLPWEPVASTGIEARDA